MCHCLNNLSYTAVKCWLSKAPWVCWGKTMHYIITHRNTLGQNLEVLLMKRIIAINYLGLSTFILNIIVLMSKILSSTFFKLIISKLLANLCRLIDCSLQDMSVSHTTNLEPQCGRHTNGHIKEPNFTHFSPHFSNSPNATK